MLEDAILVRHVARSICELLPDRETYIELLDIEGADAKLFGATVPPPIPSLHRAPGHRRGQRQALWSHGAPPDTKACIEIVDFPPAPTEPEDLLLELPGA